jgi:hypothetical protein
MSAQNTNLTVAPALLKRRLWFELSAMCLRPLNPEDRSTIEETKMSIENDDTAPLPNSDFDVAEFEPAQEEAFARITAVLKAVAIGAIANGDQGPDEIKVIDDIGSGWAARAFEMEGWICDVLRWPAKSKIIVVSDGPDIHIGLDKEIISDVQNTAAADLERIADELERITRQ